MRNLQQLAGYPVPPPDSPNLKTVLEGIKTHLAKPTKQPSPMSLQILYEISEFVDQKNPFHMANYSAILTGFYLILCASNLVPTTCTNFNPHEQFTCWNVGLDKDGKLAMFVTEWSKTIQHCRKELWVPVMPAELSEVCLITMLKDYFKLVPALDTQPCFAYRDENGALCPLTYDQLNTQLEEWVTKKGQQGDNYTVHTLRRGDYTRL